MYLMVGKGEGDIFDLSIDKDMKFVDTQPTILNWCKLLLIHSLNILFSSRRKLVQNTSDPRDCWLCPVYFM